MTAPLDLDAIRARIAKHTAAIGPGGDKAWTASQLAGDVPALVAELEQWHAAYGESALPGALNLMKQRTRQLAEARAEVARLQRVEQAARELLAADRGDDLLRLARVPQTTPTTPDLATLARLAHAADLPWEHDGGGEIVRAGLGSAGWVAETLHTSDPEATSRYAQYIVAACNAAPALLAEVGRLREVVDAARELLTTDSEGGESLMHDWARKQLADAVAAPVEPALPTEATCPNGAGCEDHPRGHYRKAAPDAG